MSLRRWDPALRHGLSGLLAGVVLAWSMGVGRMPTARAQVPGPPTASASGTIAFASASSNGSQLLYLIDTKAQSFAVYRIDPQTGKGTIKLEGARRYRGDLMLSEYNNQPPGPAAIESMVQPPR